MPISQRPVPAGLALGLAVGLAVGLTACSPAQSGAAACDRAAAPAVPPSASASGGPGSGTAQSGSPAPSSPAADASGSPAPSSGPGGTSRTSRPRASRSPTPVPVVRAGTGRLEVVPGTGARSGRGPLRRYRVEVERGIGIGTDEFARAVERTLSDRRSWGASDRLSFQRVARGPVAFRVVLASPRTTDRLCRPLRTNGTFSCGFRDRAVVNSSRWLTGASAYRGMLEDYRTYVVNHEVGHALGHGHQPCPGRGRPAPVMMQQTKGVGACRPSPWPYP